MKKIFLLVMIPFLLVSCGTPKVESPEDALAKNQAAIVKDLEKMQSITQDQLNSQWTVSIDIAADSANISGGLDYDFDMDQKIQAFSWNINLDFDAEINNPTIELGESFWWGINMDLITLKNKLIFKLNKLEIKNLEENPQFTFFLGMIEQFKNNWYFLEIPETDQVAFDIDENLLQQQKQILEAMKKYTFLKPIRTNLNENYYDYDVELNKQAVVWFVSELQTKLNTTETFTENDKKELEKSIDEFNSEVNGNIKIDKDDLWYFILNFSDNETTFALENLKGNLNFSFIDTTEKLDMKFNWKKTLTGIDARLIMKENNTEVLNTTINFSSNGITNSVLIDGNIDVDGEKGKIKIEVSDTTTPKVVHIIEPNDQKSFEEVITNIIWWGF